MEDVAAVTPNTATLTDARPRRLAVPGVLLVGRRQRCEVALDRADEVVVGRRARRPRAASTSGGRGASRRAPPSRSAARPRATARRRPARRRQPAAPRRTRSRPKDTDGPTRGTLGPGVRRALVVGIALAAAAAVAVVLLRGGGAKHAGLDRPRRRWPSRRTSSAERARPGRGARAADAGGRDRGDRRAPRRPAGRLLDRDPGRRPAAPARGRRRDRDGGVLARARRRAAHRERADRLHADPVPDGAQRSSSSPAPRGAARRGPTTPT